MRNLNDIFNIDTSKNLSNQLEIAVEKIKHGDSESAYEHLTDCLYDEISSMPEFYDDRHADIITIIVGNFRRPIKFFIL